MDGGPVCYFLLAAHISAFSIRVTLFNKTAIISVQCVLVAWAVTLQGQNRKSPIVCLNNSYLKENAYLVSMFLHLYQLGF